VNSALQQANSGPQPDNLNVEPGLQAPRNQDDVNITVFTRV